MNILCITFGVSLLWWLVVDSKNKQIKSLKKQLEQERRDAQISNRDRD